MKVTGHHMIRGRGVVSIIDELPEALYAGMRVQSTTGDPLERSRWFVRSIETHAMPRSCTNGLPAGLLLEPGSVPEVGDEIVIVKDESYWRTMEHVEIARFLRTLATESQREGHPAAESALVQAALRIENGEHRGHRV